MDAFCYSKFSSQVVGEVLIMFCVVLFNMNHSCFIFLFWGVLAGGMCAPASLHCKGICCADYNIYHVHTISTKNNEDAPTEISQGGLLH
jgi:hypothetical protein